MRSPVPISVIMVSWHTGPSLFEAIEAVFAAPDIDELILLDNGNPKRVRQELEAIFEDRDDARLLAGQGNVGFARACNLGARAARGDVVLFLNPDALIKPGVAAMLAQAGMSRGRDVWLAGARLLNPDGTEQRGARRGMLTPQAALIGYSGLYRLERFHPAFRNIHRESETLPEEPVPTPVVSGAAMAMPRRQFLKLGGFDERYFLHVEDIDLCRRVAEADGVVIFHPHAEVMHYGSTSRAALLKVEWAKSKGFIHYFWKFARTPWGRVKAVIASPFIVAALMGRASVYTVRNMAERAIRRARKALRRARA